jgi:hypothetical protein
MKINIPTTHQSSPTSSSSRNLIFVAGLPSKISKKSVEAYFHQFGSHITVHFVSSAKMKRHDPLDSDGEFLDQGDSILPHRGFCLLEISKKQTYNTVLEVPVHVLYGRRLFCSPFKSGFELAKHNASTCGRRAILKKVPLPIEERNLVRELELIAGPVESIYQFVSDCPTKTTKQGKKKHGTFSVTFKRKAYRDLLANLGKIKLSGGQVFTAEKYEFARKKTTNLKKKRSIAEEISAEEPVTGFQPGSLLNSKVSLETSQSFLKDLHIDALLDPWVKPTMKAYPHRIPIGDNSVSNIRYNCTLQVQAQHRNL